MSTTLLLLSYKNMRPYPQNFLRQILKIFVSLTWILEPIKHKNGYFIIFIVDNINLYWYLLRKILLVQEIHKILWPKVRKNLWIWLKKFCESQPWSQRVAMGCNCWGKRAYLISLHSDIACTQMLTILYCIPITVFLSDESTKW